MTPSRANENVKRILIGASPKARLVLDFLASEGRLDEIDGIVDRDPGLHGTSWQGKPVLASLDSFIEENGYGGYAFCPCLSERNFGDRAAILDRKGVPMFSIVSARADVEASAAVGPGSIVFPHAYVGSFAEIGRCVTVYVGVLVGHDCRIEDNVEISGRVALAGGVRIGSAAFLGMNATVLPDVVIGSGAVIAAGAVVTRDVAEGALIVGNPGKVAVSRGPAQA